MAKVEIYTWQYCPFCIRAKSLLKSKGITYKEFQIDDDQTSHQEMTLRAEGRTTVPQIFINDIGIGGCDELFALDASKQLEALLAQEI